LLQSGWKNKERFCCFQERFRQDFPAYENRPVGDLPWVGSAGEVAQAVVALCTLDWVTGQIVAADGGVSLASPIDPMDSLS